MTEWRDIPGFEGEYQVSDDGQVRSLDRVIIRRNGMRQTLKGKLLKPGLNTHGRLRVQLDRPKNYQVHRLVMLAFVGECPEGMEVCHNDGNPLNNRLDNLRYDTPEANAMDDVRSGRRRQHRWLKRTSCSKGHEFTADNVWFEHRRGFNHPIRHCKACTAEWNQIGSERRKAARRAA